MKRESNSFFLVFLKIRINSKTVNYLSSSAIAIYLIQNSTLISDYYYHLVSIVYLVNNMWTTIAMITISSLAICLIAIFIDKICSPILELIYSIPTDKYKK